MTGTASENHTGKLVEASITVSLTGKSEQNKPEKYRITPFGVISGNPSLAHHVKWLEQIYTEIFTFNFNLET